MGGWGLQLPLVLANRPLADPRFPRGGTHLRQKKGSEKWFWVWGEDLEGGACSDNLYTSGPRPRRIIGDNLGCSQLSVNSDDVMASRRGSSCWLLSGNEEAENVCRWFCSLAQR